MFLWNLPPLRVMKYNRSSNNHVWGLQNFLYRSSCTNRDLSLNSMTLNKASHIFPVISLMIDKVIKHWAKMPHSRFWHKTTATTLWLFHCLPSTKKILLQCNVYWIRHILTFHKKTHSELICNRIQQQSDAVYNQPLLNTDSDHILTKSRLFQNNAVDPAWDFTTGF